MYFPPLKSTTVQGAITEVWKAYGDGTKLVSITAQDAIVEIWTRLGNTRKMQSTDLESAINEVYTSFDYEIGVISSFDLSELIKINYTIPPTYTAEFLLHDMTDGVTNTPPPEHTAANAFNFESIDYVAPTYVAQPTDEVNRIDFENIVYVAPTYVAQPTDEVNRIDFEDW